MPDPSAPPAFDPSDLDDALPHAVPEDILAEALEDGAPRPAHPLAEPQTE